MNQVMLVGRLVSDPQINETEERKVTTITLAISRSYKNENGEYEADSIPCVLWNGIASATTEYCRKGDFVGLKGRLQINEGKVEVVVENVTFILSRKVNE